MRWPGLGRRAGSAPYVAIAVGIISGNYIFAEPLKAYFAAKEAEAAAAGGGAPAKKK